VAGGRNPLQLPPGERRAALSQHLLAVLEPLLADGTSYGDLSVERIIRAGKIARRTFYAYFADKGDLLQAMAGQVIDEIFAGGHAWWALADDATRDDLRAALQPAAEAYLRHRTIMRAVAEASAYDARVRDTYGTLMAGTIRDLRTHLERQQEQGLAHPSLDPERTATWVVWMLERGLYQAVSADGAQDAEPWIDTLAEIVWRALYEGYR